MKKALVVIDFQNDFISGSLGFPKAETIRQPIVEKIEKALKEGTTLIFTMDTHDCSYLFTKEGEGLPIEHCTKGHWGWELDDSLLPYKSKALVIEKSSFGSKMLGEILAKGAYDEVELCGLVTSICVLSNAVIAKTALPEATIIVDSKATEDASEKASALACLKAIQVSVL